MGSLVSVVGVAGLIGFSDIDVIMVVGPEKLAGMVGLGVAVVGTERSSSVIGSDEKSDVFVDVEGVAMMIEVMAMVVDSKRESIGGSIRRVSSGGRAISSAYRRGGRLMYRTFSRDGMLGRV